ncbi:adenosine deaminase family protein [Yunchengibacter salinarum]|uniref:adenosine deaminase family protein n=1 Tax=Yunchengibacter salinarum TaxID=3133399 RepID=UPI0035B5D6DB
MTDIMNRIKHFGVVIGAGLVLAGCIVDIGDTGPRAGGGERHAPPQAGVVQQASGDERGGDAAQSPVARAFEQARTNGPALRRFLEAFPKGGDLHNHLTGAVYAESWLDWAAEDGLCVNPDGPAIVDAAEESCADRGWVDAREARLDEDLRRRLINGLSLRSFKPENGWSGHDQFFVTFSRMLARNDRFGDMLTNVSRRAAWQNIPYLELMHTLILGELFPLVGGVELTGDPARDYRLLMDSPFGARVDDLAADISRRLDGAFARRAEQLQCGGNDPLPGCDVTIRLQHQVIREFSPAMVYAQIILGWHVMERDARFVGLNLVAPEDGYIALRDYTRHMRMIDHLYATRGQQNIALHAGELTLGLVRPRNLRFHIRQAIEIGHARRIGHGIDIAHERDSGDLLARMVRDGIAVEINLTSNDVILGVTGRDHPFGLYRRHGVPLTLSTDDEGVSRIDLTHEYQRAVETFDLDYQALKRLSRNAIRHSFLDPADRAALMERLDSRLNSFEQSFR